MDFERYAGLWGELTAGVLWQPGAGLPSIALPGDQASLAGRWLTPNDVRWAPAS